MGLLAPLAFALAALLPVIVVFYFLKLRREARTVSSTYLWQELVRDLAANAPWQRLRFSWLLVLQLLFLIALIFALARPFTWQHARSGEHLILVLDTSASMAATDVRPDRLSAAAEQARRLATQLPAGTPVTVINAADEVSVVLSASTDRPSLTRALEGLRAGLGGSDMATALELASAVAAGEPDAEIVVLSDGAVSLPERLSLAADVRFIPLGVSADNQAITALSLDPGEGGQGLSAFVRIANPSPDPALRRLTLRGHAAGGPSGGALVAARDLALPAGEALVLTIADLPPDTVAVEARLEGEDVLALDDRAWAVAPVVSGAQIQIVGPGNRFLETAFALLPGVEVTTLTLEDYEAAWSADEAAPAEGGEGGAQWLTVFDTVLPATGHYPPGALLFVGPLRSTEFFSVTGSVAVQALLPASADEPLLRFVDLRDIGVEAAARVPLPAWGRPVVVASGSGDGDGAPLLVTGALGGRRLAVLAFDVRRSDLPLRVAFPLLLANLVNALAPGTAGALPASVAPGQPVPLALPPQAESAAVMRPDGRVTGFAGAALALDRVPLFADTSMPGVYEVTWTADGATWPLGRFAVAGADPGEADVAPRAALTLGAGAGRTVAAQRLVRQEHWRWLAWAGLALLLAEWLEQYRGQLAWLRERLGLRRRPAPARR